MTKTPEELTEDWKARKLKPGSYYVRLSNGNLDVAKLSRFNRFYGISYHFEVEEILAPCNYDHFADLRKKAEKYDRIKVNGNYPDKISKLKSRIKKLLEKIEELESDSLAKKEGEEIVAEQQAEINRLRKAINSALNFMACPDDLSGLTGKCNDQAAFDVLREALNNESEE